ncbi:MAG: hypothetical protein H7Z39_18040 [Burkholderiaceae bacterium]|nr:hypothetical protein [Burkholderiaceae bacterium]
MLAVGFPLDHQPVGEIRAMVKRLAVKESPPIEIQLRFHLVEAHPRRDRAKELRRVQIDLFPTQMQAVVDGEKETLAQGLAQLENGLAQIIARRVMWNARPKQFGQRLPGVGAIFNGEIGQQRQRLDVEFVANGRAGARDADCSKQV